MNTIKFKSGKDMKEIKEGFNKILIMDLLLQAQMSLDNIALIMKMEGNDVSIVEDTKSILDKISELI